jgi:hypothetical protein
MTDVVRLMPLMGSVHRVRLDPPAIGYRDFIAASYEEACDRGARIAANTGRVLVDDTGRMGPKECAMAVDKHRLRKSDDGRD